ncbi:UDP-N-acetylmuramate dehydrogenase [Vibrio sp. S9_S30]|uniref:UDP-N-acetylmuramate dehydrogenase n=1 Tax=Vibrio sp. S9_S30 TaxID=2720226 RepID=UPI0016807FD6|nr:UDP-N-acetylmuramate dehydrogenase [Vibrio sp. S9_S30]MBD1557472.1 UDP-N-acetylmuramate dehydrogenase [Vibrio sp. S9_S30]
MQIYKNNSLKPFHTFGLDVQCRHMVVIESIDDLKEAYANPEWVELPKLILGKGSNVLFTQDFLGVVLLNRLRGKSVIESDTHFHLHAQGGEDWPEFVEWTLEHGYFGLENLALIPGCIGSAPIQNIGAYGVELKDICEYVDIYCIESRKIRRLTNHECQFGYRDSIFKHELKDKAIVVSVGLKVAKNWTPKAQYGALAELAKEDQTALNIYKRVCDIRRSKLPDPCKQGNAGSFFKNPVISQDRFDSLESIYPDIVGYPAKEGVKLAAGWLIDHANLKGEKIGGAMVHPKQALVLVNAEKATSNDVISLAAYVRQAVLDKYQVELEHEVRFIGRFGETYLAECLKEK